MGKPGRSTALQSTVVEQRNAAILRRYAAGETLSSIGAGLDISRERVRQIIKRSGADMPWDFKCAVGNCFRSPRSPQRYCHIHKLALDRYGDPLGTRPLLREQHGTRACYVEGGCRCERCRQAVADRGRGYAHRKHHGAVPP